MIEPKALQTLWEDHVSRRKDNERPLWCILNSILWLDLFVYNKDDKKNFSPWDGSPRVSH